MIIRGTHIQKITRFILSNSLGTLVDTFVLWIFSHFIFSTYAGQYLLSPFISFECAVFTNFICSWHFIWHDRVKCHNMHFFWRKYIYYNLSATGIFIVKMGFLLLFARFFAWHIVICNLAALCISGTLNFSIGEWLIFKNKKPTSGDL